MRRRCRSAMQIWFSQVAAWILFIPKMRLLLRGSGRALLKAGASDRTVRRNVRCLLGLGHWLVKNGKPGIAARLSEESLDKDAQEFGKQEGQAIATPLDHLRASQSPGGIAPIASRVELNPHPQDADLIKRYKEDAASGTANTVRGYATLLIDFSDYLRESDKPGIAARLGDGSLDDDVSQYKEADPRGRRKAGAALAHLLRSPAGARAIELRRHIRPVPDLEDAVRAEPRRTRAATAQHSGSNGAISWPETLPANQQDLLLETMDGPSCSPPLETIAHHQQAADAGGSFRDLNLTRDDHGVPPPHGLALHPAESLNWRHHDDELTDKRHRNPLGPGEQVLVNDEHDIGELRSAKRQKTLSNPQGVAVEHAAADADAIPSTGGVTIADAGSDAVAGRADRRAAPGRRRGALGEVSFIRRAAQAHPRRHQEQSFRTWDICSLGQRKY
ncbi:hypothetical protein ACVWZR_005394 [Bradyrhizobium sp. i1.3.1]